MTQGVVEGGLAEGVLTVVVVDEVAVVAVVEEGEDSRMAYFECAYENLPPVFRLKSVYRERFVV